MENVNGFAIFLRRETELNLVFRDVRYLLLYSTYLCAAVKGVCTTTNHCRASHLGLGLETERDREE
jgi:hypothetical protein